MSITPSPRLAGIASVVVLAVSALAAPTATAGTRATEQNGICEDGEICFYYGSDLAGSLSDFSPGTRVDDYGDSLSNCYRFISPGAGQGQCIKNNAESITNNTDFEVNLHTSGPVGEYDDMTQFIGTHFSENLDENLKNYNGWHIAYKGI